jgi:hypothetical protein
MTTDAAEALVERQAQAFEAAKPYLVERWRKSKPHAVSGDRKAVTSASGRSPG